MNRKNKRKRPIVRRRKISATARRVGVLRVGLGFLLLFGSATFISLFNKQKSAEKFELRQNAPLQSISWDEQLNQINNENLSQRVEFWSERLARDQTLLSELRSEVSAISIQDEAPLIPSQLDCTTYIETVAALARSNQRKEFAQELILIRYRDGKPTFASRNHFPEADWLPNNLGKKILKTVNEEISANSGGRILTVSKEISRLSWLALQMEKGKIDRGLASFAQKAWNKMQKVELDYLPVSDLKKILPHLRTGTIINFVHADVPRKPVLISHQGLIIRKGDVVLLRHASRGGRIQDIPLSAYLKKMARDPGHRKWPIIGFHFNQLI